MNDNEEKVLDTYRAFQLMAEIANEEPVSQRELARRLGIALGLVNSYMKNLVAKGYVRVKNFPSNRYAYLLTPQGVAEKSRLAYQHLSYFTNLYKITRDDYVALFQALQRERVKKVAFCGVDEVTEIAYLSLRETAIELAVVMDDEKSGERFFDIPVVPIAIGLLSGKYRIVITSLKNGAELRERLMQLGVDPQTINVAGGQG